MSENNTQDINSLSAKLAGELEAVQDLLPLECQGKPERLRGACIIAAALDMNPVAVLFGRHLDKSFKPVHAAVLEEPADAETNTGNTAAVSWPQKQVDNDGLITWCDSAGDLYDENQHAWNKADKIPSVKADGTFRGRRNVAKAKTSAKVTTTAPEKSADPLDEQALVDANQVLGSFKKHVNDATTTERLDQLRAQIELMGFTDDELAVVKQWIEKRAQLLTDD